MPDEQVVLVDDAGSPIGVAPKSDVHSERTPLHLAFSCYLARPSGEILLTRRALTKATWPGVWSNSFCGHPQPGEQPEHAVARRARQELGVGITGIRLVLPDFRYRAVDAGGIVENEICPVYWAELNEPPRANPAEVAEWVWVAPEDLRTAVQAAPFLFSPWLVLQYPPLQDRLKAT